MAKTRRKRKSYTPEQRKKILAAANKHGLTALDVKKKYGVTPVTYYSWRKKVSTTRSARSRSSTTTTYGNNLNSQVRTEVRQRVRQVLPGIVRGEVNSYLNTLFASGRGRRYR